MKLTESHFYFVANYSVLSDIFEFSKRVVENFVHFMQLSGRVHISSLIFLYFGLCDINSTFNAQQGFISNLAG